MTNVGELWRNLIAAGATCVLLVPLADDGSLTSFIVGLLYAGFFEYFYHRYIGHTNLFSLASEKHRQHHREWRTGQARSTDRRRKHLNEAWYFFPAALLAHAIIPKLVGYPLPWTTLLAFTLFYTQFEFFHWATHITDNWFDSWLANSPKLRFVWVLRAQHIDWHLTHHMVPKSKYNFTPPYPGDVLFRTSEKI